MIYYVKHTTGDDTAAGTEGAPWAHCPGMTDWAPGGSGNHVDVGDTVYFDKGETWTDGTGGQGEVLRPQTGVTYDGSTWGSGTRATLQASSKLDDAVLLIKFSNVTVKGFNIDANHFDNSGIGVNKPYCTQNISNIEINNCVVYNTCLTDDYFYGIGVGGSDGYLVDDLSILNCIVHDTGHEGIALHPYQVAGNTISNITIRNCEVYNTGLLNSDFGVCILVDAMVNGATIEYNYLHDGTRGIEFYTRSDCDPPTNIVVRYNIIKDQSTSGLVTFNDGSKIVTANVYGNLFIDNGKTGMAVGGAVYFPTGNYSTSIYKFYNNIFYSIINTATTPYCFRIDSEATGTPTIECKNNIFYSDDHILLDDRKGWITHNNNLYFRTDGAGDTQHYVYNGTTNYHSNSYTSDKVSTYEPTAYTTDPTFKNTSSLPTGFTGTYGTDMVPNADGLSIISGNAIDHGADLGTSYNGAINLSGRSGGIVRG